MIVKAYASKSRKATASVFWGGLLVIAALLFFLSLKGVFSEKWSALINGFALLLFTIITFRIAIRFGMKQPVNRAYIGELHFQNHGIRINDLHYPLEEIERIFFIIHENESDYSFPGHQFELYNLASGTENQITIKLKGGSIHTFNFLLKKSESMVQMKSILEFWYRAEKISFLNLCDTLSITDYDAIQVYKNRVK
jgi:hypothetical protein